jgi:hypothetical protein
MANSKRKYTKMCFFWWNKPTKSASRVLIAQTAMTIEQKQLIAHILCVQPTTSNHSDAKISIIWVISEVKIIKTSLLCIYYLLYSYIYRIITDLYENNTLFRLLHLYGIAIGAICAPRAFWEAGRNWGAIELRLAPFLNCAFRPQPCPPQLSIQKWKQKQQKWKQPGRATTNSNLTASIHA